MSVSILAESAKIGGVKTVAIVDDAYDPPRPSEIQENSFNKLNIAIDENKGIYKELNLLAKITEKDLDDFETFLNNKRLIISLWELSIGSHGIEHLSGECQQALTNLFEDVATDRHSKLSQIKPLEDLLQMTGVKFFRLGSSPDPNKVAKADVVFLDLYLSDEVPSEINPEKKIPQNLYDKARDRAIGYVKDVRKITDNNINAVAPAFILISSQGSDHKAKTFRDKTGQMKSRFRFISKQALRNSQPDAILAIDDIFRTKKVCSIIEPIQKSWPNISKNVSAWIQERIFDLDITDFGHLYHLQLREEGLPITDYVKELIAGAVAERICSEFTELNLPKFNQEEGNPFDGTVPKFFDPPSNGFAELYSMTRISKDLGYRGKTNFHPQSGDIFLRGEFNTSKRAIVGKEVFSVMSPACDLIDRNDGKGPNAKSVLLLEGTITKVMLTPPKTQIQPQIICINDKYFEISWQIKNPSSTNFDKLLSEWGKKEITWLGRLKGEHFLSLQTHFLADLGRVGVMKAPSVYERLAGDIHIKNGDDYIKIGNHFSATKGFAYLYSGQISFSGSFVNYFIGILKKQKDLNQLGKTPSSNINKILEDQKALVSLIEMKLPQKHNINNLLTVEILNSKNNAISINNNGKLLIRLFC